jgi:hypothetical protein
MDIDDDSPPFHPSEWIGKGRSYKDAPHSVIKAQATAKAIPSDVLELFPDRDEATLLFTNRKLPMQSSGFSAHMPSAWFSEEEPAAATNLEVFSLVCNVRNIPPDHTLEKLTEVFGQQWLDGKKSLVDPRYSKGLKNLPMWSLSVWKYMSATIKKQRDWREALTCVSEEMERGSKGLFVEEHLQVDKFFGYFGWDSKVTHGGFTFTTHTFAQLLCKRELSCDVTQAMVHILSTRLDENRGQFPHHIIAGSRLYTVLELASARNHFRKNTVPDSLKLIEKAVSEDPNAILWLPVLHSQHEVVIQIDFGTRTVNYGT